MIIAITPTPELEKLLAIYQEWLKWAGPGRHRQEIKIKAKAIELTLAARKEANDNLDNRST